jgi:hypothetical protein
MLKQKMVIVPILVFPYWSKEFHVHVNAYSIALGFVLTQLEQETSTTHYPLLEGRYQQ